MLSVEVLDRLIGEEDDDVVLIKLAGISEFYFPYIDINFENRFTPIIISLDGVYTTEELFDLVKESEVTEGEIVSNITIMYKTDVHAYDSLAHITTFEFDEEEADYIEVSTTLARGWLPWRRCYCDRRTKTERLTTGGTCSVYKQSSHRCDGVCSRTGFINQQCSGDFCPSC